MSTLPDYQTVSVSDRRTGSALNLFYREAGHEDAPAVLLLHGFPASSHQYRGLIARLGDKYRVIAPDLPGFGFSDAPDAKTFGYTFDHLAEVIESFTDAIGLTRYALYVFDYGAPVGFRLAVSRPERVSALISQNGNAYEEGLSEGWNPIRAYWREPSDANRAQLRGMLAAETTQFQYRHGEADTSHIAPESYTLDQHFLDRAGSDEIQLDLFGDYRTNVAAYPRFHEYFRTHRPPTLAVWGKNDPFFLPAGAEAFRRDIPDAEVRFVDGGHFPLESHLDEVAGIVRAFLARTLDVAQGAALFGMLGEATTPAQAQPILDAMRGVFGFVPNLGYALAAEPTVLGAYLAWLQALGTTSLDPIAQQVAMAAASRANAADYGVAVHATLAARLGASGVVVDTLRNGGAFVDPKLEAVRRFATAIASKRTQVSDSDVNALKAAGFDRRAAVAIAMAVAGKTLANTVAHLSRVEIDAGFLPGAAV
ncbi:alpha/beta fold hydrolase [Paraburkholderia lycopersici]|uniref:Pimeloyl-ACP methyl ester carboxylesterase n=1 Tax=Paraburkholderia lycopersici TaxID=416944 RepID=A0A1G6UIM7_9BURK|nr:alpha/beta fold hydrolase [Paraburkholderia lycopersici]SDD41238.1 Pimeloyl-ACP methyl ester carboxylesterase [Paraburkholderia lycopersici]